MKLAAQIGLSILEFWELTPLEFELMVNAYTEKISQEQEDNLVMTWLGAYWQRVEKLPSLKKVLGKDQVKKQPTAEEMFEEIKRMHSSMGGKTIQ
jgi:hypothetical protein